MTDRCIICGKPTWRLHTAYCSEHRPPIFGRHSVVTFNDESLEIKEWAERIGIEPGTLVARIYRYGWPVELALTRPNTGKRERWRGVADRDSVDML